MILKRPKNWDSKLRKKNYTQSLKHKHTRLIYNIGDGDGCCCDPVEDASFFGERIFALSLSLYTDTPLRRIVINIFFLH